MITLNKASITDLDFIVACRNTLEGIKYSKRGRAVSVDEYSTELGHVLLGKDPTKTMDLIYDTIPVGYIRFDIHGEDAEVGIALEPKSNGKGYGPEALEIGCRKLFSD